MSHVKRDVRSQSPACLVVAVPVGSASAVARASAVADRVVCLESPPLFYAVGQFYADFRQTSDDEARRLLQAAWAMLDDAGGADE